MIAVTTTTAIYSCWGHAATIFAGDVAVCDSKQGHPDGISASRAAVWGKGSAITEGLISLLLPQQLLFLAGSWWKEACSVNRESFFSWKKDIYTSMCPGEPEWHIIRAQAVTQKGQYCLVHKSETSSDELSYAKWLMALDILVSGRPWLSC